MFDPHTDTRGLTADSLAKMTCLSGAGHASVVRSATAIPRDTSS
jgi:hypothetical protein